MRKLYTINDFICHKELPSVEPVESLRLTELSKTRAPKNQFFTVLARQFTKPEPMAVRKEVTYDHKDDVLEHHDHFMFLDDLFRFDRTSDGKLTLHHAWLYSFWMGADGLACFDPIVEPPVCYESCCYNEVVAPVYYSVAPVASYYRTAIMMDSGLVDQYASDACQRFQIYKFTYAEKFVHAWVEAGHRYSQLPADWYWCPELDSWIRMHVCEESNPVTVVQTWMTRVQRGECSPELSSMLFISARFTLMSMGYFTRA